MFVNIAKKIKIFIIEDWDIKVYFRNSWKWWLIVAAEKKYFSYNTKLSGMVPAEACMGISDHMYQEKFYKVKK